MNGMIPLFLVNTSIADGKIQQEDEVEEEAVLEEDGGCTSSAGYTKMNHKA